MLKPGTKRTHIPRKSPVVRADDYEVRELGKQRLTWPLT